MRKDEKRRILGRLLAKELTLEQLKTVSGGSVSQCHGASEVDDGDTPY